MAPKILQAAGAALQTPKPQMPCRKHNAPYGAWHGKAPATCLPDYLLPIVRVYSWLLSSWARNCCANDSRRRIKSTSVDHYSHPSHGIWGGANFQSRQHHEFLPTFNMAVFFGAACKRRQLKCHC